MTRSGFGLVMVLLAGSLLCGCGREMIFKEKEKPASTSAVKAEALQGGAYYVKDGTDFYRLYEADANFSGGSAADPKRIIWTLEKEDGLIPVLKAGEPLVYCIDADVPQEVVLERFKDIGFSIGASDLSPDDSGMAVPGILKPGSSAERNLVAHSGEGEAKAAGIESVSEKKLTERNLSSNGSVTGLKKGKTYRLGVYAGSKYAEVQVKADTHFYQSSETLVIEKLDLTRNGYLAIDMPRGLKSGYYCVPGGGLFLYRSGKGSLNKPNRDAATRAVDDTLGEETRTYAYKARNRYETLTVRLDYDAAQSAVATAYIRKPGGEKTQIRETVTEIRNAVKGTYTVFVKGKNADLVEVSFEPGAKVPEKPKKKPKEKESVPDVPQAAAPQTQGPAGTAPQTVREQVPATDPLTAPEISGTIGD